MIEIHYTSKEDNDDVIACAMILGKDVAKLKEKFDKKGFTYSDDTTIKNKIKDKVQ